MARMATQAALPELLLGEWACLGVLAEGSAHGYAVAQRLAVDGDLGRVWTLSRPMTYRCLAQLEQHRLVRAGATVDDGPRPRTLLAVTPAGSKALDRWLAEPAAHLRDIRNEFLLKVLIAANLGRSSSALLDRQAAMADRTEAALRDALAAPDRAHDPVLLWRLESVGALHRLLTRLAAR
jgi:DNA-binding PadR family transcriptional regulator